MYVAGVWTRVTLSDNTLSRMLGFRSADRIVKGIMWLSIYGEATLACLRVWFLPCFVLLIDLGNLCNWYVQQT